MIKNKKDYMEYYLADNADFLQKTVRERLVSRIAGYPDHKIYLFKKYLRKAEYAVNTSNSKLTWLVALYYERKKNRYGDRLGVEIEINCFGKGLQIYHGGIVVHPAARIGANCRLHGGNCIGNDGKSEAVPVIGDNVDIGYGACVIGDVVLADNITIGCNAVVVKSCGHQYAVLAGVPAKQSCRND